MMSINLSITSSKILMQFKLEILLKRYIYMLYILHCLQNWLYYSYLYEVNPCNAEGIVACSSDVEAVVDLSFHHSAIG